MPIRCQSCVDPTPFKSYQSNPVPIRSQSDTNSVPIQFHFINSMPIYQSNANQLLIHSNLPIHHQSTNILPILGQSANPSPSCQSITNHRIRCISWTNLQIHHRSANPMPVLDQSINLTQIQKYKTNPMPICQSNANIQPIQKYNTNPLPIPKQTPTRRSKANLPIHYQSNNPRPIGQSDSNPSPSPQSERHTDHVSRCIKRVHQPQTIETGLSPIGGGLAQITPIGGHSVTFP